MAVFRINKTKNYTVMSNTHLRDKNLSFKGKGLLSMMLSLPDDWDYSVAGLVAISLESETAVKSTLKELEDTGYLVRDRVQDDKGHFEYIYNIYEQPLSNLPQVENPPTDVPPMEVVPQLNTNKSNTIKPNTYSLLVNKIKQKENEFAQKGNGARSFILAHSWAREQPEYLMLTDVEKRRILLGG